MTHQPQPPRQAKDERLQKMKTESTEVVAERLHQCQHVIYYLKTPTNNHNVSQRKLYKSEAAKNRTQTVKAIYQTKNFFLLLGTQVF